MDPANQFAFRPGEPRRDWAAKAVYDAQKAFFAVNPDAKGDPSLVWNVQKMR